MPFERLKTGHADPGRSQGPRTWADLPGEQPTFGALNEDKPDRDPDKTERADGEECPCASPDWGSGR